MWNFYPKLPDDTMVCYYICLLHRFLGRCYLSIHLPRLSCYFLLNGIFRHSIEILLLDASYSLRLHLPFSSIYCGFFTPKSGNFCTNFVARHYGMLLYSSLPRFLIRININLFFPCLSNYCLFMKYFF